MTKREFIQVIVRMAGVILLVLGAWYSLNLLGNIIVAASLPRNSSVNMSPVFVDLSVRVAVLVAAGAYLIRDGEFFFDLLNR